MGEKKSKREIVEEDLLPHKNPRKIVINSLGGGARGEQTIIRGLKGKNNNNNKVALIGLV